MPKRKPKKSKTEPALKKLRKDDEAGPTVDSVAGASDGGLPVSRQDTYSASLAVKDGFTVELGRLAEHGRPWRHWGPYLSERQWGTVREDQSNNGACWDFFTHDEAVYRTYSLGEDGLLGICDDQAQLCLALALWNGVDTRLKERLFGLSGPQGNHGEDVKEVYFYLDSTPSHSYMKALYKYPQLLFPYGDLISKNATRTITDPEYELVDTGVFNKGRYWDVLVEYAKSSPHDILCQYTVHNRGPDVATIHVLPTLWFRNTWSQGPKFDSAIQPMMKLKAKQVLCSGIASLGNYIFSTDTSQPQILFTNNETNFSKVEKDIADVITITDKNHFKDSFHDYIIKDDQSAKLLRQGTKCAFHYRLTVPSGCMAQVRCRLHREDCPPSQLFNKAFEDVMNQRQQETDQFYNSVIPGSLSSDERLLVRQAYSGLCWSKQFYYFDGQTITPGSAAERRNPRWRHLRNSDVISMPDKWEFPWYAPWDLAFQMLPFADIDIDFAKSQLLLVLSDRYQHPNGQLPGCEFDFSATINPPIHAWACLHLSRRQGSEYNCDLDFLKSCFHKLTLNFNWWMNQIDVFGRFLFSGGFLGMDNISVFDRSLPPEGVILEQADGTAWMAFYARCMMEMALELSKTDNSFESIAITYLSHFVSIAEAIHDPNYGLWDVADGFFYDRATVKEDRSTVVLRVRSLVGLVSLFPAIMLRQSSYDHLMIFKVELAKALDRLKRAQPSTEESDVDSAADDNGSHLLSLISHSQFKSLLCYLLDESEFLAPFGIRSLSKVYGAKKYSVKILGQNYSISYSPGDSNCSLFGGNSNWRGPVWICMNYLLLEALDTYGDYFTEALSFTFPTGSQRHLPLHKLTNEIRQRIAAMFLLDSKGHRPLNGKNKLFVQDPHWKGMVQFYEFYNPDTGQGHGASHQTGWSALIANIIHWMTKV